MLCILTTAYRVRIINLDKTEVRLKKIDKYTILFQLKLINPQNISKVPSPSSLMDFGWETAKHCIVSYFWCASWLSWPSSSGSIDGLTNIRQLKVWLLRLGASADQDPPFTVESQENTQITCSCGGLNENPVNNTNNYSEPQCKWRRPLPSSDFKQGFWHTATTSWAVY